LISGKQIFFFLQNKNLWLEEYRLKMIISNLKEFFHLKQYAFTSGVTSSEPKYLKRIKLNRKRYG
jgi:hypothetical protein